jgi:hypothetical protein
MKTPQVTTPATDRKIYIVLRVLAVITGLSFLVVMLPVGRIIITHSDSLNAKIALIVLTPFLVLGVLLFFTRRNPGRQFFILWPIILAVTLWLGFGDCWKTRDFVRLGIILFFWVMAGFRLLHKTTKQ